MKPSAYLINVARGGVLDEEALRVALHEQRLAGAALDVFRERPLPPDHPLWSEEKIIITPHIGGMSDVYLDQAYPIVRDNIGRFLAGDMSGMKNIVAH
jgi:phosphoglycerate dehydrogenase-like enzyme